jgi:pantothenate kinase type III
VPEHANQTGDICAMDVGNTSVKAALRAGGHWEPLGRVATRPTGGLARRLADALGPALRRRGAERCLVCSVCPEADEAVASVCGGAGLRAEFFGRDLPVPMPTTLPEPGRVGTDRLLLALAARRLSGAPCIVVSAGTAITVDLVDPEGAFAGGAIGPGFGLAAAALSEGTARLPLVEPVPSDRTLGRDTTEALRSGLYWCCAGGAAALVQGLRAEPGCADAAVVCTGTDAALLLGALEPFAPRHEPHLIFRGMAVALRA